MIAGISSYLGYHNPTRDISIILETSLSYRGYKYPTLDISTLIGRSATYHGNLHPKRLFHYEINYKY